MRILVSCETRIVSDIPVSDVPIELTERLSAFDCVAAGMFMTPVAASAHPTRYPLCRSGFTPNPFAAGGSGGLWLHRNRLVVCFGMVCSEKGLGARQMPTYRGIAVFVLALTGTFVTVLEGKAQVACYGQQEQLPAQTVADFIANPPQLLQRFPNGGPEIISKVRDLVASNPASLQLILDLVKIANPTQIDAIGTGLGQGALACVARSAVAEEGVVEAEGQPTRFSERWADLAVRLQALPILGTPNHEPNFFTLSNVSGIGPGGTTTTTTTSVSPTR